MQQIRAILCTITFLTVSFSSPNNNLCNTASIRDSLLSNRLNIPVMRDTVLHYISQLLECKDLKQDTIFINFAKNNSTHGYYALKELATMKSSLLLTYINNAATFLKPIEWEYLVNGLSVKNPWQDSNLIRVLSKQAICNVDADLRAHIFFYFSQTAQFHTANFAASVLKNEADTKVSKRIYWVLLRYKDKQFDSLLHAYLAAQIFPDESVLRKMKLYNRYDFLSELYALKSRFKNELNPLRKSEVEEILTTLEDVIPYLEKKKEEKAAIGLTLD